MYVLSLSTFVWSQISLLQYNNATIHFTNYPSIHYYVKMFQIYFRAIILGIQHHYHFLFLLQQNIVIFNSVICDLLWENGH